MSGVGVSEGRNNFIFSLKNAFDQLGISESAIQTARNGGSFDAVLVGTPPPSTDITFNSHFYILPDCIDRSKFTYQQQKKIISYGLRRKNTVTATSLIGKKLVVALQEKIPTISGNTIDEQEFPVKVKNGSQSDKVLGVVSTLLTLDIPIEEISKIDF